MGGPDYNVASHHSWGYWSTKNIVPKSNEDEEKTHLKIQKLF